MLKSKAIIILNKSSQRPFKMKILYLRTHCVRASSRFRYTKDVHRCWASVHYKLSHQALSEKTNATRCRPGGTTEFSTLSCDTWAVIMMFLGRSALASHARWWHKPSGVLLKCQVLVKCMFTSREGHMPCSLSRVIISQKCHYNHLVVSERTCDI